MHQQFLFRQCQNALHLQVQKRKSVIPRLSSHRFLKNCGGCNLWLCSFYTSFFLHLCCKVNGFSYTLISAAAADVTTHSIINIFISRVRILPQQNCCRHNLSTLAVTTLRHIFLYPCKL